MSKETEELDPMAVNGRGDPFSNENSERWLFGRIPLPKDRITKSITDIQSQNLDRFNPRTSQRDDN